MLSIPHIELQPNPSVLKVFALGAGVLTAIMLFHGSQLGRIVRAQRRSGKRLLENALPPWRSSIDFGAAIIGVVILHTVDVGAWAFVLYATGLIPNSHASIYFTASTYTTLGGLPLGPGWRDLSPIVAMSGLLSFAWTTAAMYNLLVFHHALVDELREEYARKMQMRAELRSDLRAVREHEAGQERVDKAAARQLEGGKTFFERWRMRRDERTRLQALREQARRDADELFRKERDAEKKIYQPPDDKPKI
jgi:hypothetical protein